MSKLRMKLKQFLTTLGSPDNNKLNNVGLDTTRGHLLCSLPGCRGSLPPQKDFKLQSSWLLAQPPHGQRCGKIGSKVAQQPIEA